MNGNEDPRTTLGKELVAVCLAAIENGVEAGDDFIASMIAVFNEELSTTNSTNHMPSPAYRLFQQQLQVYGKDWKNFQELKHVSSVLQACSDAEVSAISNRVVCYRLSKMMK